jgi:hypothetical protein
MRAPQDCDGPARTVNVKYVLLVGDPAGAKTPEQRGD